MSYYIHGVPGRLRVKTPVVRGSQYKAEEVQQLLKTIRGIMSVTARTLTGSLVISYDPTIINQKEIVEFLKKTGYFDDSKAVTNDHYIQSAVTKVAHIVNKAIFGAFVGTAFEGSALSFLIILI